MPTSDGSVTPAGTAPLLLKVAFASDPLKVVAEVLLSEHLEVEAVKRRLHTTCNIKPAAQKLTLLHLDGFPAAELSDDKAKLSAYNPLPLMTISVDVSEPITESAAAAEQQPPQ